MLMTILPEDTALVGGRILKFSNTVLMIGMKILWYNKSRVKSRICPACLRLYNIGDELRDLTSGGEDIAKDEVVLWHSFASRNSVGSVGRSFF
jgi:hypothetical protein